MYKTVVFKTLCISQQRTVISRERVNKQGESHNHSSLLPGESIQAMEKRGIPQVEFSGLIEVVRLDKNAKPNCVLPSINIFLDIKMQIG